MSDPYVSYWRWFHNMAGIAPGADTFSVDVSRNNGASWVNVETVGPTGDEVRGGWRRHAFRVRDFVSPSNEVRVRFVASDTGAASVVEAGVDDFRVFETTCDDCNGNGTNDAMDIAMGTSLDLDGDGLPDECQPLSADVATISLSAGGSQNLTLDAGVTHESMLYWMFGSVTGTAPGLLFGTILLPLNFDVYFNVTLTKPFAGPFAGFLSFLDASGQGTAAFSIPSGFDPGLAGVTLFHAFTAAADLGFVHFASNAIPVTLVP